MLKREPRESTSDIARRWVEALGSADSIDAGYLGVVDSIAAGDPDRLRGELRRYGRERGADGFELADVSAHVDVLVEIMGVRAGLLTTFATGIALSEGWLQGHPLSFDRRNCTDSLTGLTTTPVLRLRLTQAYQQCAALGILTEQTYCLVIIDTDMTALGPLERDAALVVLANETRRCFDSGETMAICDSRVLILASRGRQTRERLLDLLAATHVFTMLSSGSVFGWIEDLPPAIDRLDTYLMDVTASFTA